MNQKVFVQKIDELLETISLEELRSCLHNIARKTPESKRDEFLQMLEDCNNQNSQKETIGKSHYKRLMPDEKVKDKITDISEAFKKIKSGESCLSAQGYEDYSNGYWASDWMWEYEGNEGVGRMSRDLC